MDLRRAFVNHRFLKRLCFLVAFLRGKQKSLYTFHESVCTGSSQALIEDQSTTSQKLKKVVHKNIIY